ncbi:MAG: glycosyltransferase [Desulfarculales bacterium]|jgi:hypothetical protein|nr:glycosyltransferase [Desulfarculales bacterium]
MKIFLGMFNISSLYQEYVKGFTALGHEVFSVDFMPAENIINDEYTSLQVPNFIRLKMEEENTSDPARQEYWSDYCAKWAWQKAMEADLCFFMWLTFTHDNRDLAWLKNAGKKIVVRFIGTESRVAELDEQFNALHGRAHTDYSLSRGWEELAQKIHYVRSAEKYADLILGPSTLSLRPNYHDFFTIDYSGIPFDPMPREIPVLLHAPSSTATKGTQEWQRIFAQLAGQGLKFEPRLVQEMEHNEFLKEYAKADIHCGGLYIGGKAELEALAGGAVPLAASAKWPPDGSSVGGYIRELTSITAQALGLDKNSPEFARIHQIKREYCQGNSDYFSLVQHVTPQSAADVLRYFILNPEKRYRQAVAGREFIEKYCSPQRRCAEILDMLANPDSAESQAKLWNFDFFHKKYRPRQDAKWLDILNKGTATVRDCQWYKQYIKPLSRDGLLF